MKTKICSKCKIEKYLNEFHICISSKDKSQSICKECYKSPRTKRLNLIKKGFKLCSECKKEKSLSKFYKSRLGKFGVSSICKNCYKNKSHDFYIKHKANIDRRTKNFKKIYPWKILYQIIKNRCQNLKNKTYGGRGIKCLFTLDELKELWFRDKAYEMKCPSIHRKDNNGNYTYKNCEFIEKSEHTKKHRNKNILQYDLQGNFIKEWESQRTIERELGFQQAAISSCCLKNSKTSYNFIWRFK